MQAMRAVRFHQFGDFKNLKVEQVPRPRPGQGQVLVKIVAAAINPSDAKNILGSFHETTLPRTPGRDYAGIIVEGPQHLMNKEVWGSGGNRGWSEDGTHAEYVVIPEDSVILKPSNLSLEESAAVGVGFLTAWTAIHESGLQAGEPVVIVGARGSVGSAASQICKAKKAHVIGAVRGKVAQLPKSGEDPYVDDWVALEEEPEEQVKRLTNGRGAAVVFDTVGGNAAFSTAMSLLGTRGRLVEISATGGAQVTFNLQQFYRKELRLIGVNTLNQTSLESAQALQEIGRGFEAKMFSPPTFKTFKLEDCIQAFEEVNKGSKDKILLAP
jgi:NADPH:quinone reductase-like Zn-dependent oxidoreductase